MIAARDKVATGVAAPVAAGVTGSAVMAPTDVLPSAVVVTTAASGAGASVTTAVVVASLVYVLLNSARGMVAVRTDTTTVVALKSDALGTWNLDCTRPAPPVLVVVVGVLSLFVTGIVKVPSLAVSEVPAVATPGANSVAALVDVEDVVVKHGHRGPTQRYCGPNGGGGWGADAVQQC